MTKINRFIFAVFIICNVVLYFPTVSCSADILIQDLDTAKAIASRICQGPHGLRYVIDNVIILDHCTPIRQTVKGRTYFDGKTKEDVERIIQEVVSNADLYRVKENEYSPQYQSFRRRLLLEKVFPLENIGIHGDDNTTLNKVRICFDITGITTLAEAGAGRDRDKNGRALTGYPIR
jgi:hypothetical protein